MISSESKDFQLFSKYVGLKTLLIVTYCLGVASHSMPEFSSCTSSHKRNSLGVGEQITIDLSQTDWLKKKIDQKITGDNEILECNYSEGQLYLKALLIMSLSLSLSLTLTFYPLSYTTQRESKPSLIVSAKILMRSLFP